jgi:solute:Na+ symporter, SSS family
MIFGTIAAYRVPSAGSPGSHFGGSTDVVPLIGHTVYIAVTALVINLVLAVMLTFVFRAFRLPGGADETLPAHHPADPEPSSAGPVTVAAGTEPT